MLKATGKGDILHRRNIKPCFASDPPQARCSRWFSLISDVFVSFCRHIQTDTIAFLCFYVNLIIDCAITTLPHAALHLAETAMETY